jgi:Na+/glutamate symporter
MSADDAMRIFIVGALVFGLQLLFIWEAFWTSVDLSDPPTTVYMIIFFITILYASFGIVSLMDARGRQGGHTWFQEPNFERVEMMYIVLSLVSKTFLLNMALFGSTRSV